MTMISLHGVRRHFDGRAVLDDLGFEVRRGELYGLLGPNGCGKSTAMNIVAGLLAPDAGEVRVAGEPVSAATRRRLGLVPQEAALYRDLRPAENIDFFARIHGLARPARARRTAELVELLGLGPHLAKRVGDLSGGWRQRVNLAVALVHEPDVLLLDEPTSAVDIEARHALWQAIDGLRQAGTTMLMTTHHLEEAARLCTRVGLLRDGRLAAEGTVPELLARVPAAAVAFVEGADAAALAARAHSLGWPTRRYAGRLALLLPRPLALADVVAALSGLDVSAAAVQPVTLEHAYLEVMQAPPDAT